VKRVLSLLRFVFESFGPLVVFYATLHFFGLMTAIAVTVVTTFAEVVYRLAKREKVTRLFKMSAALTLAFGAVDLLMQRSVLFRFEAVITNCLVGAYFGSSLFGPKSMIEELYEKSRSPGDEPPPPEAASYQRGLTRVWTGYFFAKAAFYLWVTLHYTLEQAVVIRSAVGTASLVALLGGERLFRKPIFRFVRDRGWIHA
jgi:uncharacterized membrane protein